MTEIDAKIDALVPAWLTLPDIAEKFGVEVTRVRQLVKEGQLIAVRRGENRALHVPAAFIDGDKIVKGLTGTLTLLRDDGFTVEEMLEWLFTPTPACRAPRAGPRGEPRHGGEAQGPGPGRLTHVSRDAPRGAGNCAPSPHVPAGAESRDAGPVRSDRRSGDP